MGFAEELSKSKVKELRKASCAFTSGPFRVALENEIFAIGVPKNMFELRVANTTESDRDPQVLELFYMSSLEKGTYLKEAVLIEIGARSLREPSEQRVVGSIITETLGDATASGESFNILTVTPVRTVLEKIFLLHEEFSKPVERIRTDRMSRHLYDIDRIMDTKYGDSAISDTELYVSIVDHRSKFNVIRGIDYSNHGPDKINFIPPKEILNEWEADYKSMQKDMIYGESKPFKEIISRLSLLQEQFHKIGK